MKLVKTTRNRGAALITVLLLTVVLLILCIAFLFFAERNYRFAGLQENQNKAYFLAQAGLEYYRTRPEDFVGQGIVRRPVPLDSDSQFFEVNVQADGTIECKGIVVSPLTGLRDADAIERVIIVPQGSLERIYDQSQDL